MLHKTLSRQLRKNNLDETSVAPNLQTLLQTISDTYQHADEDRKLNERSFDISSQELNQLNFQLQSERDRAQTIIHSIIDGLVVLKKDFTIDIINPQAEILFEVNHNQELGHFFYEVGTLYKGENKLAPEEGYIAQSMNSGTVIKTSLADNLYVQTKSGKRFPVVLTTTPLLLPNTKESYGVLLVIRDVSMEKQQHDFIESEVRKRTQELEAERNKISITLASISDAVLTLDLHNTIIVYNKSAEVLLGIPSREAVGHTIDEIIRVFENSIELTTNTYSPSNEEHNEVVLFTKESLEIKTRSKTFYANMIVGRIKDNHNVHIGNIITLHDVSKEKQLEDMKLDFVSMAAHELRTPLTAIRGIVSILKDELTDKLNPEQSRFMDVLTISIESLANLINNLLNVSRIEQSSLVLEKHIIDLHQLTIQTIEALKNTASSKHQSLTYEPSATHFSPIYADSFRIGEVLMNLIGNAISYTPINGKIVVKLEEKDGFLRVSVTDSGEGIPPQFIKMLFTKFFRVSGVLEQGSKGTGLGLYISKSIINMHNGEIGVESTLGVGSTFHFSLPIAQQEQIEKDRSVKDQSSQKYGMMINEERRAKRLNKQTQL